MHQGIFALSGSIQAYKESNYGRICLLRLYTEYGCFPSNHAFSRLEMLTQKTLSLSKFSNTIVHSARDSHKYNFYPIMQETYGLIVRYTLYYSQSIWNEVNENNDALVKCLKARVVYLNSTYEDKFEYMANFTKELEVNLLLLRFYLYLLHNRQQLHFLTLCNYAKQGSPRLCMLRVESCQTFPPCIRSVLLTLENLVRKELREVEFFQTLTGGENIVKIASESSCMGRSCHHHVRHARFPRKETYEMRFMGKQSHSNSVGVAVTTSRLKT